MGEYFKELVCFVDLEKANDRVLREKLWGVLRSTVLPGACYWP